MKKKFAFMLLILLIVPAAAYSASAEKAGYILKIPSNPVQKYVGILENMSFTVDLIDDDNLAAVNFSQYSVLLVGDGVLKNVSLIPVNKQPALIANMYHMDEFLWSSSTGVIASNGILKVQINDPAYFITEGFPGIVDAFTTNYLSYHYLPKEFKSPWLKTAASLVSSSWDGAVVTAKPGTRLKDGSYASAKGVFFGINNYNYWSNYTELLFRNSITWLATDMVPPEESNITAKNITNESARITWVTDRAANSTLSYGKNLSLDLIKINASFVQSHEALLENLEELTNYYYQIKSCNQNGYCSNSSISNFSTLDLTPPYLTSASIINITNSSVNISITTNNNSNLTVFYGLNKNNLDNQAAKSSFGTSAAIFIGSLAEDTLYFYKAKMCDIYSNCQNSSLFNFTTLDFTPPSAPENLILEVINSDNSIKVNWDAPSGEAAAQYNIYISDNRGPADFDFENPNASTALTEYIDNSASSANERYYAVRSQDAAGNEENNANIAGKFDLELIAGYNLVSFPLTPFNASADEVMHQDASYKPVSEIKKYDNINKEFKTITFNGTTNQWGAGFNGLAPSEGYFFKSSQEASFTIVGYPASSIAVSIAEGLNLAGLALYDNKTIEQAIIQSASLYNITEIASRNDDGSYNIAAYYEANGWFNGFDIEPAKGYWLKANKNFTLTIS